MDGSAWTTSCCEHRMERGGCFDDRWKDLYTGKRAAHPPTPLFALSGVQADQSIALAVC